MASKPALAATDFDSVDWSVPKLRGLNTERMADGINDSIKEKYWLISGIGQPEYFNDAFVFTSEEDKISIA